MVRSLLGLGFLAVLGIVISFLPSPKGTTLGKVLLSDVELALYPAADQAARWTFTTKSVVYDPGTRESLVEGTSEGKRFLQNDTKQKNKLDLTITAKDIVIDAADNLRVQTADIYVIDGCWSVKLGRNGAIPVYINQERGYTAPYAEVKGPNATSKGTNFDASFDLEERFILNDVQDTYVQSLDGSREECQNGKIVRLKPKANNS